jgi:cyanate permease
LRIGPPGAILPSMPGAQPGMNESHVTGTGTRTLPGPTRKLAGETERAHWGMLALGWLLYASFAMINASLFPLVTPIRDELGFSYSQMGVILGAWQLVYIGAAIPVGVLVDRFGTRRSLLVGALIIAASGFARSLAVDFPTMLGAVALFGLGGPVLSIGLPKLVAEWFTGRKRGLASGIYFTGSHFGSVLVLAGTNSLVLPLTGSWRATLQVYGVAVLLIASLWLLLGRQAEDGLPRATGTKERGKGSIRDIIGVGAIWPVVIIGFSGFLGSHGFRSWLPQILETTGFSAAAAGWLAAGTAVAGMVGSITIMRVAGRGYRKPTAMALLTTVGLMIGLVGFVSGPLLLVVLGVQGFCAGAMMPLMMNTLMEMPEVGARYMGAAAGLYFSVGEIGGFLGPSMMGVVTDLTGSFQWGLLTFSLTFFLMLIPATRLRADRRATTRA